MYTLRAILVCCSVFMLVYVAASVALGCASKPLVRSLRACGQVSALIYAIRMSPLLLGAAAVSFLTLPAFLRYEPAVSGENVGVLPVIFSLALLLVSAVGVSRACALCWQTEAWLRRCLSDAEANANCAIVVVSAPEAAPVALAGLRRSTVLISASAQASLSGEELRCAIEHELAHARAADNLKKLLMHACAFPKLGGLERAWLESIEFAADQAAARSEADAMELASALVKVSRLQSCVPPALVTCLTESPPALLAARIERLLGKGQAVKPSRALWAALAGGVSALACTAALNYGTLLRAAHDFTELLVR